MTRTNLMLLIVLVACGISLVTSRPMRASSPRAFTLGARTRAYE